MSRPRAPSSLHPPTVRLRAAWSAERRALRRFSRSRDAIDAAWLLALPATALLLTLGLWALS